MQNLKAEIRKIIKISLDEDCTFEDITSDFTVPENNEVFFVIKSREKIILCGVDAIKITFDLLQKNKKFAKKNLKLEILAQDGNLIKKNGIIAQGYGNARLIFAAERVMLNFIQYLSGITTVTKKYQNLVKNSKTKILDTRKTTPTLRYLEKYAVKIGGGENHRFNLSEMILIKDNHIAAAQNIKNAIILAKKSGKKIEIECDNLTQVKEALEAKPDIIMLDNMNVDDIKKAQKIIGNQCKIEISGGINLTNIKKFANIGVDFISIGSITHSATSVDIGLDVIPF